jgi:hypothetical protein
MLTIPNLVYPTYKAVLYGRDTIRQLKMALLSTKKEHSTGERALAALERRMEKRLRKQPDKWIGFEDLTIVVVQQVNQNILHKEVIKR